MHWHEYPRGLLASCGDHRWMQNTPKIGNKICQRAYSMEEGPSVQGQRACEPGPKLGLASAVSTVHICRDQGMVQI